MGLRSKMKARLRQTINSFSGEYSSAATQETIPYERPGQPQGEVKVPKARLKRPREQD